MSALLLYRLEELHIIAGLLLRRVLRINLAVTALLLVIFLCGKIQRAGNSRSASVPPVHRCVWMLLWAGPFFVKSRLFENLETRGGSLVLWVRDLTNQPWIEAVYFGAALFFILRRCRRARRLKRRTEKMRPFQDRNGILKKACQKCGNGRIKVRVLLEEALPSPCSFGIRHPVIILPADYEDKYDGEDLFLILLHELIHIQGRDLLWYRLLGLLQDIGWFNPFLFAGARRFVQDTEIRCDYCVLNVLEGQEHKYGMVLLKSLAGCAESGGTFTAALHGGGNIRERLEGILSCRKMEKRKIAMKKVPVFLLTVTLCAASCIFSSAPRELYRLKGVYEAARPLSGSRRSPVLLEGVELTRNHIAVDWKQLKTAYADRKNPPKNLWLSIDMYETGELFTCGRLKVPADDPARYYDGTYRELADGRVLIPLYEDRTERYIQLIIKYL